LSNTYKRLEEMGDEAYRWSKEVTDRNALELNELEQDLRVVSSMTTRYLINKEIKHRKQQLIQYGFR
jgi:hypothetical protein